MSLVTLPLPRSSRLDRIAIIGSASGSGKTTLARRLAERIGGTFVELDAFRHGPNWTIATTEEMRAKVAPIVETPRWVMDGTYSELGPLIAAAADLIVWLDLPPWVWFPRLARRSARRLWFREELWNGNRENLRGVFLERDGVFPHAVRAYFFRRGRIPVGLTPYPYVRLRTVAEVEAFVASVPSVPVRT